MSSRERSKKASSDASLLGFDLLYQLTYLSSISAAGIPRSQIFKMGAALPCSTSRYFQEVDRLAEGMNYQYSVACRIVGESIRQAEVRSLFLRLSSSLDTGEPAMDFLNREAQVQAEAYGNSYERKLETLKKWTDAYIALMVAVALIIVVATISTVIYDMGTGFVAGLVLVMVSISGLGAWLIYRTAPQERKTLDGPEGEPTQRVPRKLFLFLLPGSLMTSALAVATGLSFGWAMVAAGVLMLPIGIASVRYDRWVDSLDAEVSTLLRALGSTASAIGTTPAEALGRMDLRSLGALGTAARRLYIMLRSQVSPALCWYRFVLSTGSELIKRGVRMFQDGIALGGDAEEVGTRSAVLTTKVNFLREKRKLVSSSFGWLAIAMHGTIVFLQAFIIEVVSAFGQMVQAAGVSSFSGQVVDVTSFLSFNFESMGFLKQLVAMVVVVLSIINAFAAKAADGGYSHRLFLYLGTMLLFSGLSLALSPRLTAAIFGLAPTV